jgi:hypothetical protein
MHSRPVAPGQCALNEAIDDRSRPDAGASAMEQHIDISRREAYLTDSEFEPLFRMTRSQYEALPDWHKAQLKKELFLF